jgi:hypothetical protein
VEAAVAAALLVVVVEAVALVVAVMAWISKAYVVMRLGVCRWAQYAAMRLWCARLSIR